MHERMTENYKLSEDEVDRFRLNELFSLNQNNGLSSYYKSILSAEQEREERNIEEASSDIIEEESSEEDSEGEVKHASPAEFDNKDLQEKVILKASSGKLPLFYLE